jgi:hypothetical protein
VKIFAKSFKSLTQHYFTETSTGATFDLGPLRTENDFFLQFFPENLVERLVTETNNYAKQMTEEKPDGNVGFSWNFHD